MRSWAFSAFLLLAGAILATIVAEAGRPNIAPLAVACGVVSYVFSALACMAWAWSRR